MTSAFGIDHKVSKALTPRGRRKETIAANRAARSQARAQQIGQLKKIPGKVAGARVSIKDIGTATGKGVQAVGTAAVKRPGVTGAAVLGGGGYAAYRNMQSTRLPKKKVTR